jgi:TRAP-type C4-dicarboxylate transport system permease small subunit
MKILKRLATVFALFGCLCACAVALLTVASITGRAVWGRALPGDVELTQFGIALAISLGLPWAQLQRANIIVDFFTQRVGATAQRWLDASGALLLALMCSLLAWRTAAGAWTVREAQETSMILELPMWLAYAALAPGLALSAVIALVQSLRLALGKESQE